MLRYIAQNPEVQEQLIEALDDAFPTSDIGLEEVYNVKVRVNLSVIVYGNHII